MRKKTVLVTGGSRGIGLAIVRQLASEGYNVVAVARSKGDAIDGIAGAHFLPCDLGDIDKLPDLVKAVRAEHGAIYGLVNNAGIGTEGVLSTMHQSQISALIRLNVESPIVLTKYIVRHMLAAGEGRIINMGSIIGSTGYNGLSVYGATKAAAEGFSRSLAREVGKAGVTVNAIAPGFIATELTAGLEGDGKAKIAGRSALRRLPDVEDVARMVAFLLGEGGRNITGTVLTVDAGNTA